MRKAAKKSCKVLIIVMLSFTLTKCLVDLRIYVRGLVYANESLISNNNIYKERVMVQDDMIAGLNDTIVRQKKEITKANDIIKTGNGIEFKAEITYYSKEEATYNKDNMDKNSMGGKLEDGDWSAPDLVPLYSLLYVTYADGRSEIAYIVDRGNTDIITVFNRDNKPRLKGAAMRLDKYVDSVKGKGLDLATVKVLRWGK